MLLRLEAIGQKEIVHHNLPANAGAQKAKTDEGINNSKDLDDEAVDFVGISRIHHGKL